MHFLGGASYPIPFHLLYYLCNNELCSNLFYTFSSKREFDGEKFTYFMFLVWFQCLVNAAVARTGNHSFY